MLMWMILVIMWYLLKYIIIGVVWFYVKLFNCCVAGIEWLINLRASKEVDIQSTPAEQSVDELKPVENSEEI